MSKSPDFSFPHTRNRVNEYNTFTNKYKSLINSVHKLNDNEFKDLKQEALLIQLKDVKLGLWLRVLISFVEELEGYNGYVKSILYPKIQTICPHIQLFFDAKKALLSDKIGIVELITLICGINVSTKYQKDERFKCVNIICLSEVRLLILLMGKAKIHYSILLKRRIF